MVRQATLPLLPAPNLHGQRVRAALVGETAYVVGLPQLIAEPRVLQVTPCVDSVNVLIAREVYPDTLVPGGSTEASTELQLLLYNGRRRRTSIVFRYQPTPGEVARLGMFFWWVGGAHASFSLLLSNTARSERRVLPLVLDLLGERVHPVRVTIPPNTGAYHLPSPTQPFAALVQSATDREPGKIYRIHTDGSATLVRSGTGMSGFLPDGESSLLDAEEDKPDAPRRIVNLRTGKEAIVPRDEVEKREAQLQSQAARDLSLKDQLPLRLYQKAVKGEPSLRWLTLGPQKPGDGEEVLLVADAEPAGLTRDLKALFYYQQGQLYLAPVAAMPRQAFLSERDRVLRELTLRRATLLAMNPLQGYFAENRQTWPSPGADPEVLFKGGLLDRGPIQNPLTGRDDLRFEYNGTSDPLAGSTRVASLGGPAGRAVIFGDGHVTWEPQR